MSKCHVFIVNETTFYYHLKYLFAGTTAGAGRERNISLLADIARTRPGDHVIFYLQQRGFYGIFEVVSDTPLLERSDGWLQTELGIPLIYRVRICPLEVYPYPVSEWKAVDELPARSREIRWSLLYRKLKGERGCSYLFPQEYESLAQLIRSVNNNLPLNIVNQGLIYNAQQGTIEVISEPVPEYAGSSISPYSHVDLKKGEAHLQAWLMWHIGRNDNTKEMIPPSTLSWFANEVYAGSGMQKMDVLCLHQHDNHIEYRMLELKKGNINNDNLSVLIEQTRRYVWWIDSYQRNSSADTIGALWIARGFGMNVHSAAKRLLQEEFPRGLSRVELWQWDINDSDATFKCIDIVEYQG